MLFHSAGFLLIFLPLVLLTFWVVRGALARRVLLAFYSYLFYSGADPSYLILLFLTSVVDFYAALGIARSEGIHARRSWLFISVCLNLSVLGYFKYWELFSATFLELVGANSAGVFRIFDTSSLPPGLSFYTFQSMSYTIDVYRGHTKPERKLLDFCNFVAYFPQLIAGPIERYSTLAPQLSRWAACMSSPFIVPGLNRIAAGVITKLLLADSAGRISDRLMNTNVALGFVDAWMAALSFGLQIYFDFAAYTSIAIGLGLLMGMKLSENFNSPYKAISIRDFWRRWHITLSTWFRDYVYLALGGSKDTRLHHALVAILTFSLSGLWHGAGGNFIAWGLFHGICYVISTNHPLNLAVSARHFSRLLTFVAVHFAWILFRVPNLPQTFSIWKGMLGLNSANQLLSLGDVFYIIIVCIFIQLAPNSGERPPGSSGITESVMLWLGALVAILLSPELQTFIYFRF